MLATLTILAMATIAVGAFIILLGVTPAAYTLQSTVMTPTELYQALLWFLLFVGVAVLGWQLLRERRRK